VVEHVIVPCDNIIQCDCVPLQHPKCQISKWPQYFHVIHDNRPVILRCE
jgi:hypothetical protein